MVGKLTYSNPHKEKPACYCWCLFGLNKYSAILWFVSGKQIPNLMKHGWSRIAFPKAFVFYNLYNKLLIL